MSGAVVASELVTAAVAVVIAVLSAGVSVFTYLSQRKEARHQAAIDKADQAEELMSRYRDPLIHAAFDLQSRLYNILAKDFLGKYYTRGTPAEHEYATESTLHVIGEYLGWVEILRREVRFLDLQDVERNRALTDCLQAISRAFYDDTMDPAFRVFRGEQRAIGEVMSTEDGDDDHRPECIGYASFVARRDDPEFARWFAKLREDIDILATDLPAHRERLTVLHAALIDLIDFLDPEMLHFPKQIRTKIDRARAEPSMAARTGGEPSEPAGR